MLRVARVTRGVIQVLLIFSLLAPVKSASLCRRCETTEIQALKRYYGTLQVDAVTFRGFIMNLLMTMESMPHLAPLKGEIMELIHRYDDCVRTCEIPFTKRAQHEDGAATLTHWLGAVGHEHDDLVEMVMWRKGQVGDSISLIISPEVAENLLRGRLDNSQRRKSPNYR